MLALKAYIMAKDEVQYDHLPADMILLDLTHSNLKQQHVEIRFYKTDTLETLRQRIHQKSGTGQAFQHLQVFSAGIQIAEIPPSAPETLLLGYFSLEHGMRIHCIDLDPHSGSSHGQYENVDLVKKYRMSDEDYDKRKGTLRDWERSQKSKNANFSLRQHAQDHARLVEAQRQAKLGLELPNGFEYDETGKVIRTDETDNVHQASSSDSTDEAAIEFGPDSVAHVMDVGLRCEVQPGGRRGVVAFVGDVPDLNGHWVGVKFDEPVGKTNGTTPNGVRYFDAELGYGGFVRGKNLVVGDEFTERDIFDELDDDSEDEL
jgi:tubulin-folding cofactor B